jgi:hypothetical protein
MKLQRFETPDYILWVSDKEPEDIGIVLHNNEILTLIDIDEFCSFKEDGGVGSIRKSNCKKVIAHQPKGNAPELDLPLLPEIDVEDDVENQKWYKDAISVLKDEHSIKIAKICLKAGYKAATKVYSEEDLIEFSIWRSSTNTTEFHRCSNIKEQLQLWKSLKQPKTPKWFVAEMETLRIPYGDDGWKTIETGLKTTKINGKTYLVGTYLYE